MIDPIARLRETDPSRLGPYRLCGVLGSGSAGTVYLGRGVPRRGARNQLAAVRAMRPELLRDRQLRARVRQEIAQVADSVSSSFVAGAFGCELDSERPWIASAFVPGHSLTALVSHFGPLPEMSVRALGGGLARALTALHTAGVAHRDLRAANVLLTAEGPRLVDYGTGLGRSAAGPPPGGALAGRFGGLAHAADDVFELGALLVLAAGARPPFAGSPLPAAREAPDLTHVPPALHTPLLSCLHKTPETRPSPETLARTLDLSATANRPAAEWLPDSYLHEIDTRAEEARSLAGRRLFGR